MPTHAPAAVSSAHAPHVWHLACGLEHASLYHWHALSSQAHNITMHEEKSAGGLLASLFDRALGRVRAATGPGWGVGCGQLAQQPAPQPLSTLCPPCRPSPAVQKKRSYRVDVTLKAYLPYS